MHFKHGAYYLVKRNKWTPLGRNLAAALDRFDLLTVAVPRSFYRKIFDRCGRNARVRSIGFELTEDEFADVVRRAAGACEVTKIPFSLQNDTFSRRAPFAPSIDRVDSAREYTKDNCRLVCVCVNAALSDWGDVTFRTMILAAQVT